MTFDQYPQELIEGFKDQKVTYYWTHERAVMFTAEVRELRAVPWFHDSISAVEFEYFLASRLGRLLFP